MIYLVLAGVYVVFAIMFFIFLLIPPYSNFPILNSLMAMVMLGIAALHIHWWREE